MNQKFVMTMAIKDAHEAFLKKYPERKIGLTSFFKLKPTSVKKVSETNRRCCLCTICCNAALVIEAANNFLNGKEVGVKQLTKRELAVRMLCKYDINPEAKCLNGDCQTCGTKLSRENFRDFETKYENEEITYHRWETIELQGKDGSSKPCVSCVPKKATFKSFLDK